MFSRHLKVVFAVTLLAVACGRKEPPKPPPSKIPAPIQDLSIQQRGQEIYLQMTYPSVTFGGLAIESLEAIEVFEMSRIISAMVESESEEEPSDAEADESPVEIEDESEPPEPESSLFSLPGTVIEEPKEESKESLISVAGRDFVAAADLVWTLRGTELESSVYGDKLVIRIPIDDSSLSSLEEEILIYGTRSVASGRRVSPFSNLVKLLPRTPPAPPANISVEATPLGIQIDWEAGGDEIGYRVYRRKAKVREYAEPLFSAGEQSLGYLDRTAEYGRRYIFTVTSVSSREPLVESAISTEHEVDYEDRFPPAVPSEVVALAEPGRVRLLWEASTSEDTEGYWIYRQDPGEQFEAINEELILGSEYLDADVVSGLLYRYRILAVDNRDNLSEASEEIEVRVP